VTTVIIVCAVLLVALLVLVYRTFNHIIRLKNESRQAWSNIQVELRRRVDILDNMVEAVGAYSDHERDSLVGVATARRAIAAAATPAEALAASAAVDRQARLVVGVVERYPQLKASKQFSELNAQFVDTSDRVGARRAYYNQVVATYNTTISTLPGTLFADLLRARPLAYFADEQVEPEGPRYSMRRPAASGLSAGSVVEALPRGPLPTGDVTEGM
jgi:LemA protein